ncbi:DUF397 domain-containing protein [Streptomyces sp. NPDC101225]|uniref:DUF397 domain-containing protein n=1 Tax=Streptomyces sp. NPDC101225 TaxID=3366135 RepID=UPI00382D26C0
MLAPGIWQKSSYSGGGQGDACVEIANLRTRVAIRDSKDAVQGTLSFPAATFIAFVDVLKTDASRKTT